MIKKKRANDGQRRPENLEETPFARGLRLRASRQSIAAFDEDQDEPENEGYNSGASFSIGFW